MGYSVGIGLTNACNLACAHCYRDTERVDHLTLAQVQQVCQAIPVEAVGMGTGENALNPAFVPIVAYLQGQEVRLSIASNGYSLLVMPEETLRAFHDVEVSIDYPGETEHDALRGPGNWATVQRAMERCARLGIEVSILCTLMSTNYSRMGEMVRLARASGTNLRVNVYQAVRSDAFRLSYEQFWQGFSDLFAAGLLVSCSEPVVRAATGLGQAHSPCGHRSIRVNPRGQVVPCVYWPYNPRAPRIEDLAQLGERVFDTADFKVARYLPSSVADACQGGCASRRALAARGALGSLDAHDAYCPWVRGSRPELALKAAPAKDLIRSSNVCTTVVK